MHLTLGRSLGLFAVACALGPMALAVQRGGPPPEREGAARAERPRGAQEDVVQPQTEPQIAWFGRWADAAAEAKRTGRPILLMSAAPQCQAVPGIW
ncbi:MAG: hypothetical protein O2799_07975 [Planctomycetota bacterium]|nr:hypothetical protein [Planctomycetota bacterium]